jgi:hypothetical protein
VRPLRQGPRFKHLVAKLHALGPRPVGELLLQIAADEEALVASLECLTEFDPRLVAALDARDWPHPPLMLVA